MPRGGLHQAHAPGGNLRRERSLEAHGIHRIGLDRHDQPRAVTQSNTRERAEVRADVDDDIAVVYRHRALLIDFADGLLQREQIEFASIFLCTPESAQRCLPYHWTWRGPAADRFGHVKSVAVRPLGAHAA